MHNDTFYGLTKLKVLYISSHPFIAVPTGLFESLPSLHMLGAVGITFQFSQILHLDHLEKLKVQFHYNYQGQFPRLKNLKDLHYWIETDPIRYPVNDIRNDWNDTDEIKFRREDVSKLINTSIEYLGITGDLHGIENGAFSNWTTLKALDLSINDVINFYDYCNIFTNLSGVHIEAQNLSVLKLNNNDLTEVAFHWWKLTKLKILDISHNRLQYFFGFNLIKSHPRRNLQHLKYVDLSYQEFRPSSKMLTIGLSTKVTWLPKNLVYLDLAHTHLDWSWYNCIDLNENNSLQFVNLTNTGLTHLRQPVRCKKVFN